MIALDTNLLVYAHRADDSEWNERAFAVVGDLASAHARWAIPWPCLYEFFSIATHPRIYDPPSTTAQALDQIDAWLQSPSLVLLGEADSHWTRLRPLVAAARIKGPRIHDARIASLCIAHGVTELWTADRDFSRFTNLKTRNPL